MRTSAALSFIIFLATSAVAQAEDEVITVGPWTIAASSKAEKFDSCTMSRSTDDLNASFVRTVVNAAICLLAVRSRSLPDRRSDLQTRYTELACCQRLYLIGSNAVDSTIY
jgi:uncharacterized protein CbrC (UPF0167 family)